MHERLLGGLSLGDYHVDPETGWMTGPGGRVHLAPRLLRTLLGLAARAPEVIPHEDLTRFVWGEGSGGHESLSHTIGELRRVLHDNAAEPRFIETLPAHGYRLMVAPSLESQDRHAGSVCIREAPGPTSSDMFAQLRDRGVLETALP